MDWSSWIYKPGLPPVQLDFSTPQGNQAQMLALQYIDLNGTASPENFTEYFSYYSNLKVMFHDTLQSQPTLLNKAILERIDADLNCTDEIDPEVRQRWFPTGLSLSYEPVYEPAHAWVSSMGRNRYLTPVYSSLQGSGQHDLGVQWFCENIDFYHPVSVDAVTGVLGVDSSVCDQSSAQLSDDVDGAIHKRMDGLFTQ